MPSYATLCQTNPAYDADLIETLSDLYAGGFRIMRKADRYLVRSPGEADVRYRYRIQVATYQPFFGQIVDQFASDLFERNFEVTPAADAEDEDTPGKDTVDAFYTDFSKDADGLGHSLNDVLREVLTSALVQKRGVLVVDAPEKGGEEPATKADEDASGISRYYAYCLPVEQLVDWERDEDGRLEWAILRTLVERREGPLSARGTVVESFTVWTLADDGTAVWERYAVAYSRDKPPKPEDEVPRVVEPTATSFRGLPIHVMELPEGLHAGGKIGPPCVEHFRRRSQLIGAQSDSLAAIPVAALGSESSAVDAAPVAVRAENEARGDDVVGQFRGKGFVVTGKDDEIYFAEPDGKVYELVDKQLEKLRDEIFAVCHQMAASVRTNTTALGRSGKSKQADHSSTARVLAALGRIVRQFAVEVYSCVSAAREGSADAIVWSAHGLDNYEQEERQDLVEEALATASIPIHSPTFHKLHEFRLAQRLVPSSTPQEFDAIRREIWDGVDDEEKQKKLESDAAKAAVDADEKDGVSPPTNGAPPKPGKPAAEKSAESRA